MTYMPRDDLVSLVTEKKTSHLTDEFGRVRLNVRLGSRRRSFLLVSQAVVSLGFLVYAASESYKLTVQLGYLAKPEVFTSLGSYRWEYAYATSPTYGFLSIVGLMYAVLFLPRWRDGSSILTRNFRLIIPIWLFLSYMVVISTTTSGCSFPCSLVFNLQYVDRIYLPYGGAFMSFWGNQAVADIFLCFLGITFAYTLAVRYWSSRLFWRSFLESGMVTLLAVTLFSALISFQFPHFRNFQVTDLQQENNWIPWFTNMDLFLCSSAVLVGLTCLYYWIRRAQLKPGAHEQTRTISQS